MGSKNLFLSRLPDGSNIVHLALEDLQHNDIKRFAAKASSEESIETMDFIEQFIVDILRKFPELYYQTNLHGQTPLYLALSLQLFCGARILEHIKKYFSFLKEEGEGISSFPQQLPPWKVKDVQGNTLLHLACRNYYYNYELAKYLIDLDVNLVGEVNYSKETPLHMFCQTGCALLCWI